MASETRKEGKALTSLVSEGSACSKNVAGSSSPILLCITRNRPIIILAISRLSDEGD